MSNTPVLPPDVSADDAEILWTESGRPFVRTADAAFDGLPDYPWSANYAEVDGMRMHYVDAGDPDGEVVLLLHGQPDWSYLYRKMIPVLADAGFRVIAPDHIGFGKSDKPVQMADFTFLQHVAWIEEFMDALDLRDITPVVQDWGSLIGLRCVGNNPDRFARVVVANGNLPVMPEGFAPFPEPDSLEPQDLDFPFVVNAGGMGVFGEWIAYAMVGRSYMPSVVMRASIEAPITDAELAAYDVPFPARIYMAGTRMFPSLVNTLGHVPTNEVARAALDAFPRPVLGMFGGKDAIFGDQASRDATRVQIAGAAGQPHHDFPDAGHFIQEDVGADLAGRIADWMTATRRG
ncbi:MAG: haloalkane dehalogenase [Candidatus Aldehydirespiratoraceae bacterium]|jgi:haloalkane dehalogenase